MAASVCLVLCACEERATGAAVDSCDGAPAGPSGGAASDRLLLCVRGERSEAIGGAEISVDGVVVGVSDETGRVDVAIAEAIEVRASGRAPHTLLGVSSQRFGVVLPRDLSSVRDVRGTVSGLGALPRPAEGYRRHVEIRAASRFTPLSLADGVAARDPSTCTVTGDECTFSLEVDGRVSHVNATVVDVSLASGARRVAAFALGSADQGASAFAISGPDGGLRPVTIEGGADAVVGVPGARFGDDVQLFGAPSAADSVPVPSDALGGTPWLAVIYDDAGGALRAGVVLRPGESTLAPPAPQVSVSGATLSLPPGHVSTVSLGAGRAERWRVTVLDGRAALAVPSVEADRVAVLIHGPAETAAEEGATNRIHSLSFSPIVVE